MAEHIFPFLWLRGEERIKIENEIKAIYETGLRAFCVESRSHPDYCGKKWWDDLDAVFEMAQKLDMRVWLLDDVRYPTGYACDTVTANPQLQQWHITARNSDVMGIKNGKLVFSVSAEDRLIYAAAFPHREKGVDFSEPIELTDNYKDGFLFFDLPFGTLFRIMTVWKTRDGGRKDRMDMINPDSVNLLINHVYEPHYQKYQRFFGNIFQGFFSDEPGFFNDYNEGFIKSKLNIYKTGLGEFGHSYPYSDEVLKRLKEKVADFDKSDFVALWELRKDRDCELRIAYMEIITDLYQECFSKRIGKWCRDRGVKYIGHIIEDMNCHLVTGRGPGHYFKSQAGQDMAGIDIVLHQIKPYSTEYDHIAPISGGFSSPEFFYHTLAALAFSDATLDPHKNCNSLCEIFGAYGWGENIEDMKYLIDLMLVGGINHFVPHAFSPKFPDNDSPPHFYAEGKNPVYPSFKKLMEYTEYMCGIFSGGRAKVDIGVLYHAESYWSGREYMPVDTILKALHENNYNAIIVPSTDLDFTDSLACLIVPYAEFLSEDLKNMLNKLNCTVIYGKKDDADKIIEEIESLNIRDIVPSEIYKNLRFYHYIKENKDFYMFFNCGAEPIETTIDLKRSGNYTVNDYLCDYCYGINASCVELNLLPGASVVCFEGAANKNRILKNSSVIMPEFKAFLRAYDTSEFSFYKNMTLPFDITGINECPSFSGTAKLVGEFEIEENGRYLLEFCGIGGSLHVVLNGKALGWRICNPFSYDISEYMKLGVNSIEITIGNTLANVMKDRLSQYNSLTPLGIDTIYLRKYEI